MSVSRNQQNSPILGARVCLAFLVAGLLWACAGGGTSGSDTAGRSATFSGTVVDPEGTPQPDVDVTLLETGDGSETDASGRYGFEAEGFEGTTATLEFRDEDYAAAVVVPDLPADSSVDVELDVEADSETQEVRKKRLDVEEVTPSPTPTSVPRTPNPGPEPTVDPTRPAPSATPTRGSGEATPTTPPMRTPTETPSVTPTRSGSPTETPTPIPSRWLLSGSLTDRRGNPVSNATISIFETGASATTSSSGNFSFSSSVPGESARLIVTVDGISGRAQLSGLPNRTAQIVLGVQIRNSLLPPPASLTLSVDIVSIE